MEGNKNLSPCQEFLSAIITIPSTKKYECLQKNSRKVLLIPKKAVPLHPQIEFCGCEVRLRLSKKRVFCIRFALTLQHK
jgi:hypothetical protein